MEQRWNTGSYDADMAFVSRFGQSLIELLAPQAGEHILDWGCGTGDLSLKIAASGAVVTGIDASPEMIETARRKAPALSFVLADGQRYTAEAPADAVFSNAALHWLQDADGAAASIAASLRPGGRLVAEFGADGNIASVVAGLPRAFAAAGCSPLLNLPWYFPTVGKYATLLERHGLYVELALVFDRPTPLEGGEEGFRRWMNVFADGILSVLRTEERETVLQYLQTELQPLLFHDGVWTMDYRRIRVVARKRK
ncbi:methyltransferase domain-containing protein [Paenibacillus sp. NFR01]|uniref:class I SAM-dependent methyltransferase n=1 Tax=Paenibacillus sp. NFR01 TaxID=1566279 RepID=UPI0008C98862|nr:methyltransferase domain-containing protein [Paenibacillus sp. NFR01]SES97580.1 Trans-aconitate methyltransferase [Paenibacillus sp. NFR01]